MTGLDGSFVLTLMYSHWSHAIKMAKSYVCEKRLMELQLAILSATAPKRKDQKGEESDKKNAWGKKKKLFLSEWLDERVRKLALERLIASVFSVISDLHSKMTLLIIAHIVHIAHVNGLLAWYGGKSKPRPQPAATLYNRFPFWSVPCPGSVFISRSMQM